MDLKTCPNCQLSKSITEFNKNKNRKDGLQAYCRLCSRSDHKKWRVDNPDKVSNGKKKYRSENLEKISERDKQRYEDNREYICENRRVYYKNNKESISESNRKWRSDHPEKVKEINRRYYKSHRQDILRSNSDWRSENPEKVREIHQNWNKNPFVIQNKSRKLKEEPIHLWVQNRRKYRNKIFRRLDTESDSGMIDHLGCTRNEWDAWLRSSLPIHSVTGVKATDEHIRTPKLLHIDEIIPISAWDQSNPIHQALCWHYTNSQLLWADDNMRKGGYSKNPEYYKGQVDMKVREYNERIAKGLPALLPYSS